MRMPVSAIEDFIERKKNWIEKHTLLAEDRKQKTEKKTYSDAEIRKMKQQLHSYLTHRIPELWRDTQLPKYTSIKITKSEKRW